MAKILLNIAQLVRVIADTVDLVGVDDIAHGKRVGIMARECSRLAGIDGAEQELLFEAGLLHDCGVSSTRVHRNLISELDWEGAPAHCQRGWQLLGDFHPLSHMAPIVLYHHTHWEDLPVGDISEQTALHANLIYLTDRIDMLRAHRPAGLAPAAYWKEIRRRIASHTGSFFAPQWVEAFLRASAEDAFWLKLEPENLARQLRELPQPAQQGAVDLRELRSFALLIACVVDAKSPFTAAHSLGVARLARLIGELAGLPSEQMDKLEIAGLLHDIGKLQIPDEILEKPAKLDAEEWAVMKGHSFMTWEILQPIEGIGEIAQWAASHHESINGVGYPFHLHDEEIPLEARIIRVADVYQAMAQKRPYRGTTPPAEILALLRKMVAAGEIDGGVVDLVAGALERCHAAALGLPS